MQEVKRNRKEKLLDLVNLGKHSIKDMRNGVFRIGYCSLCGRCCKNIDIRVPMGESAKEWLSNYEGIEIISVSKETAVLSIATKCKYLEPLGSHFICSIHNDRPVPCRLYPGSASKFDECTYYFVNEFELEWFKKQCEVVKHGKECKSTRKT